MRVVAPFAFWKIRQERDFREKKQESNPAGGLERPGGGGLSPLVLFACLQADPERRIPLLPNWTAQDRTEAPT